MKQRHILAVLMLLVCLSIFGQQPKSVPMQGQPQKTSTQVATNQQELILQLQAENEAMQKQLEKMEKEIELYRGDVRTKISELDYAQDRWLTMLTIIMGLIGVVLGVGAPLFINRDNSKRLETRFSEMKEDLRNQVQTATDQATKAQQALDEMKPQVHAMTEQAMVATQYAREAKQAVVDVEKLKEQVSKIQEKINQDTIAAEKAAKEAKAIQFFTQALNEKTSIKELELYNQAIELYPDFLEAYNNRGILKSKMGDYAGAIADYDKAINLNANDAELYANRGVVKYNMGDKEGALEDFCKALEIKPDFANAYNNRAFTLLALGKYEKALRDVNVAIEKAPQNHCYYDTRGQIYMAMDRNEDALIDINHALSLNANYIDALKSRSKCYRKLAEAEQDSAKKADLIAKAEADEKKVGSLKKEDKV